MAHFSVWQRSPLRNNFMPSRRQSRQTGPVYRAIYLISIFFPIKVQFTAGAFVLLPLNFSSKYQTRRFLGGRQPLCGMGGRSFMVRTSMPAVARARTADSRPAPGPAIRTSTKRNPNSLALLAAVREACWAAKGVPLRDPRNPSDPELDQASTLPTRSVKVMMVLLKEAWMCTKPVETTFFSFFLNVFFLVLFAGAFAMVD